MHLLQVTNEENFEHSTDIFPALDNGEYHDKAEPPIQSPQQRASKVLFTDILTGNIHAKRK